MLVAQPALDRQHALRPVILEELLLLAIDLLHEGHGCGDAPGFVVGMLLQVETVERTVGVDLERIGLEDLTL